MKIARISYQGEENFALVEGQEVTLLEGFPFPEPKARGLRLSLEEVKLLAPSKPSKIIALGLNYRDHAQELGMPLPKEPLIFLKPPSAVIGPEEVILLPPQSQRVDYEGELAIVIGQKAKDVAPEEALDYILGYTCFNDVTARDLQQKDGQWTRAKGFDTFAPLGPWIETDLEPSNVRLQTRVNGKVRQDSTTQELVFSVPEIVSFLSQIMTLYPGDIIATGTPPGVGPLAPDDIVEVEIEGLGVLRNRVALRGPRRPVK